MKYITFVLFFISLLLIGQMQPSPLEEEGIKIQPIVDNLEMGEKYWYIQTIKLYYKDTIGFKPIAFRIGDPLISRCTDSTLVTFISKGDSLSIYSIKRISCDIVAYFNLNAYEIKWLKNKLVDKIIIRNIVTDNSYIVYVNDTKYFYKVFNKYNSISYN